MNAADETPLTTVSLAKILAFYTHPYEKLKALIQSAYLGPVGSWLVLVAAIFMAAIFMADENGDNKGQTRDGACTASWLNKSL